jgi:hypothetical protein
MKKETKKILCRLLGHKWYAGLRCMPLIKGSYCKRCGFIDRDKCNQSAIVNS